MEQNTKAYAGYPPAEYDMDFYSSPGHLARETRLRWAVTVLTTSAGLTLTGGLMN
jgi:hypothetical protein